MNLINCTKNNQNEKCSFKRKTVNISESIVEHVDFNSFLEDVRQRQSFTWGEFYCLKSKFNSVGNKNLAPKVVSSLLISTKNAKPKRTYLF